MKKQWQNIFIIGGLIGLGAIILFFAVQQVRGEISTPVDLSRFPYAQSTSCVTCHPGRYETWHQTFHRTMTQRASDESVVGDFDNASFA